MAVGGASGCHVFAVSSQTEQGCMGPGAEGGVHRIRKTDCGRDTQDLFWEGHG